ncbi:rhomboid family intramembrane serine protease [Ruminococcus gauvreauii]|uniref:rhomboid family intramembrane serine protease n=1 Tax=Ruminococcus gauvreauii TaxID=438033 RepID=UPI00398438B4
MKKKLKISFNSVVILGFVTLSFLALAINYLTRGASNQLLFMTYHSSLLSPLTYIRFFTHVLGHSGWEHFIGNMMYVLLLGPLLEEKYGSLKMLEIIGIVALVTGIINYIFFWNVALCGASGVVFAFILLSSFTRFKEGEIPLTFILVAIIFLGQQVYYGMFMQDNISNLSHIIGGIMGAVFGFVFMKNQSP